MITRKKLLVLIKAEAESLASSINEGYTHPNFITNRVYTLNELLSEYHENSEDTNWLKT